MSTGNLLIRLFSYVLLFFLVFGLSATVDVQTLRSKLTKKYAIIIGVTMQFIIMPLLGFISVMTLRKHGLSDEMGITLLMVTSSPGGSYSNFYCSTFNADLALSITMTAISTLLSMFLLPANLLFYAYAVNGFTNEEGSILKSIDFPALFISIAIVITAIVSGVYASHKNTNASFPDIANRLGTVSGIMLIIFSLAVSMFSPGDDTKLWDQDWSFYVGVSSPCVIGLLLATIIGRVAKLNKPEVVTIGIECSYQNIGIAQSAVMAMFDDPKQRAQALCVPLFYGLVEAVIIGLYCIIAWKMGWTLALPDEKFCYVISKNYQKVGDNESSVDDESGVGIDVSNSESDNSSCEKISTKIKSGRSRIWSTDETVTTTESLMI